MNGVSIAAAFAIGVCLQASAETPKQTRWTDLSGLLGESDSSAAFRELLRAGDGPQRIDRSSDEHLLVFEGRGYSIVVRNGRVATVFLQLLPGKKIRDVAYNGTMPLGLQTKWLTADEALKRFGTPVSDVSRAFRELTYERDGLHITLYHSDGGIESISIAPK